MVTSPWMKESGVHRKEENDMRKKKTLEVESIEKRGTSHYVAWVVDNSSSCPYGCRNRALNFFGSLHYTVDTLRHEYNAMVSKYVLNSIL